VSKAWTGTTFGSGLMHRWLIGVLRWMDVRLLYAFSAVFIVPVCLLLNKSRRVIYSYLRSRQGYGPLKAAWKTYTNHCMFSQVVIDRFAMYAGKHFTVEVEGYEHFQQLSRRSEGFVQLSSHIGNYEIAGYTLVAEDKPFNAVVFQGEKESIMEGRSRMFANTNIRMLPMSTDMSHLFAIDYALQEGHTVSIPADRVFGSQKTISVQFLGATAQLPQGPFRVAAMRGMDVIAVNVMKSRTRAYKIYVCPLHYDKEQPRHLQVQQLAEAYVAELERMLKLYPVQWYNFYDFWE
jgi:predicted LPLAT superfamily acyltransferase